MREFAWIKAAAELFGRRHEGAPVGIGDDCAVLDCRAQTLVSIDAVVDTVHFDRRWMSPREIGWRALAVALSDLAACGAEARLPIEALVSLQWPADLRDDAARELALGLRECGEAHGCDIVGGDTVGTPGPLALTITVVGAARRPILRSGAQAGDAVLVSGPLGAAGAGLALLRAGNGEPRFALCREAYVRPRALLRHGAILAALGATAMIDVSDGLLQDLEHICEASGVGAEIELDRLPIDPATRDAAAALELDAVELAASAGDDYQLIVCAPPGAVDALRQRLPLTAEIGRIVAGAGAAATRGGRPYEPRRRGYEHGAKEPA